MSWKVTEATNAVVDDDMGDAVDGLAKHCCSKRT
jgi:hypothetical protein